MTAISTDVRTFDDAALSAITTWNEAARALDAAGIAAESMADYGSGFSVAEKEALIGIPFIALQWRFNEGSFSESFVSVECVTRDGSKVVINDGGSGIRAQLAAITEARLASGHKHPHAGLVVEGGLRVSRYFTDSEGNIHRNGGKGLTPAATYYLSA